MQYSSPLASLLRVGRTTLAAGGLTLLAVAIAFAQGPGTVRVRVEAPLRVSVLSNVGEACQDGIPTAAMQSDAETRLQAAGITVSKVHNAQLVTDIDCIPVTAASRAGSMAVHECLSLSEVISSPANQGRATPATTWRKCQSYTCSGAKCESAARSALDGLLNGFLEDLKSPDAHISPAVTYLEMPVRHQDSRGPVIFYSGYILLCVSVLCYWRFRRQAA